MNPMNPTIEHKIIAVQYTKSLKAFGKKLERRLQKMSNDGWIVRLDYLPQGAILTCHRIHMMEMIPASETPQGFPFAIAMPPAASPEQKPSPVLSKATHRFIDKVMSVGSASPTHVRIQKIAEQLPKIAGNYTTPALQTISGEIREALADHLKNHHHGQSCELSEIFTAILTTLDEQIRAHLC